MFGIMSACSLMEETPLSDTQLEYLNIAKICGQQLLVVINDILGCNIFLPVDLTVRSHENGARENAGGF